MHVVTRISLAAVLALLALAGLSTSAVGHGGEDHKNADVIEYGEAIPHVNIPAPETVEEERRAARAANFQARLIGAQPLTGGNENEIGRFEVPFDTNDTLDGSPGRELVGPVEQYVDVNGDPIPGAFAPPGLVPVFTAVLPSGKLLAWDYEQREGVSPQNNTRVILYDPVTNTSVRKDVRDETATEGVNIFCAGYSHLPNGDLLVVGGNENANADPIADTYIFDWQTETWSKGPDMHRKRWYPSVTTMANGETLIVGGDPKDTVQENHGEEDPGYPEVWQLDGSLRPLTNLTQVPSPTTVADFEALPSTRLYPYLAPAVDGRVLYAGMEREWMRMLDPRGSGSQERYGPSDLHNRQYGSFAQYLPDRVIVNGGGPVDLNYAGASKDGIEISLTRGNGETASSGPAQGLPSRAQIADMNIARRMHHLTILPDGKVLASGGKKKVFETPEDYDPEANYYGKDLVDLANPALQAELWDPETNTWTLMDSAHEQRQYHSFATLLPSGEVLTGGGGDCGACAYFQYDHPEFEIYKPPYLFDENGDELTLAQRPSISSVPGGDVEYASEFFVGSGSAGIEKINLVKLGAATHAIDQGQRLVELKDFSATSGGYNVQAPNNGFEAPPGYYMLFLIDANGVPSPAKIVRFGGHDVAAGEVAPVVAYNAADAKSQVFGSGEYSAQRGNLAQVGNNAIKRLEIADGYEVYACAAIDLTPPCEKLDAGDNTELPATIDAKISSMLVCDVDECPEPADVTAPNVEITAPANNTLTKDASIAVSYTVTDAIDPSPDCSFASGSQRPLAEGTNTVVVSCTDSSNNTGTDQVTVVRDSIAPQVVIISPANGTVVDQPSIVLSYAVGGGVQSCDQPIGKAIALNPGNNVIVVNCWDQAGNVGSAAVNVAYVPPVKPEVPDTPPSLKLAKKITFGAELRFVPTCPAGCRAELVLTSGKRRLGGFTGPIQASVSGKTYYLPIAKRYRNPIKPWIKAKRKVLLKITLVDAKGRKASRTARVTRVR